MTDKKLLKLTVSQVNGPVFEGEVVSVHLPGIDGEMEILAGHEPLISPLRSGTITIKKPDGSEEKLELRIGTVEVSNNHATILI